MEFKRPEYHRPEPEELSEEKVGPPLSGSSMNPEGEVFRKFDHATFEDEKEAFEGFYDTLVASAKRLDLSMIPKERIEEEMRKLMDTAEALKQESEGLKKEAPAEASQHARALEQAFAIVELMSSRLLELVWDIGNISIKEGDREIAREVANDTLPFRELYKQLNETYEEALVQVDEYIEYVQRFKGTATENKERPD